MKNTLIQFCNPVEYWIFVVESDSGIDIPDKTGLKVLNNMTSRNTGPHAYMYITCVYFTWNALVDPDGGMPGTCLPIWLMFKKTK